MAEEHEVVKYQVELYIRHYANVLLRLGLMDGCEVVARNEAVDHDVLVVFVHVLNVIRYHYDAYYASDLISFDYYLRDHL